VNLGKLGERGFIDLIRRRFGSLAPPPPAGIGDDASAIRSRGAGHRLLSTDCLIEGQHFLRDEPAYLLGRKSLAVNLSDIAAMGGRPTGFTLTLGIPGDLPGHFLEKLLDGLVSSAVEHRVPLLGGDTSRAGSQLVISISVIGAAGSAGSRGILARSGARPGDRVYVSGALGGSAAGRLLLGAGWRARMDARGRRLTGVAPPRRPRAGAPPLSRNARTRALEAMRSHLDPVPRLDLGRRLLEGGVASSAIDLSDGLSSDLRRLAEASRVGARLLAPAIPIADAARHLSSALGVAPLDLALSGGEDYELLFTVPPDKERLLARERAILVGRVVSRQQGLTLADTRGRERRLPASGFDHFARHPRR